MEGKIRTLREISINEWKGRGCTGVYRWYYGKVYCVEWDGSYFDLFWEVWKEAKQQLKDLGFGVWKDKEASEIFGRSQFIIFRKIESIKKDLPEFEPNHPLSN
jgi:hypothetical protein